MKKIIRLLIVCACLVSLVSCSDPVINASSYEVMRDSYKKILYSLPKKEKQQFNNAYNAVVAAYLNHPTFMKSKKKREINQKQLEKVIGGKNAQQIIKIAKRVGKKMLIWDIRELEKRIEKIKENNKQLNSVVIKKYKLYTEKDGDSDRIFLDALIHNGSKYNLTIADFLIRIGSSYSDGLQSKRSFFVTFPEELKQGQDILKKIDLGYSSPQNQLPREPMLVDSTVSRIGGNDISVDSNIHPTLSNLEKGLKLKKSDYRQRYGAE